MASSIFRDIVYKLSNITYSSNLYIYKMTRTLHNTGPQLQIVNTPVENIFYLTIPRCYVTFSYELYKSSY